MGDRAGCAGVDVRLLEAVQETDGTRDALLQFGEGALAVFIARRFDAGQARPGALGEIRGELDLARQREHVGKQPGL